VREVYFHNIRVSPFSKIQVAEKILERKPVGQHFHFLAASTVVAASRDPKLLEILNDGVSICDSKPLSKFIDNFKTPLKNIRGADAFRQTIKNSSSRDRHFFIGTDDITLMFLNANLLSINPNFKLVGTCTLYFLETFSENYLKVLQELSSTQPTIIWVGLGSPKQDYLAEFIAKEFPASVVAIGAAFDFVSGRKTEAPKVLQKLSLEWLFRLVSEPRRLGKRYLLGNFFFIILCCREFLRVIQRKASE